MRGNVEARGRALVDQRAVAHHRDAVGELQHVPEDVGDVDHRAALAAQEADHLEEPAGLARGERGGGLVEDDEIGLAVERLGDLDELAFAGGELAHRGARAAVEVEAGEQFGGDPLAGAAVDQAEAAREAVDEDVLGDGEIGEEVEFLVDEGDAGGGGVAGRAGRVVGAAPAHGARAGRDHAADHVHQGGLAGAVLADEPQRLALGDGMGERAHRRDAEIGPREALEFEKRAHALRSCSRRVRRTSRRAAERMTAPFTMSMWKAERFIRLRVFDSSTKNSTPNTVQMILPLPPKSEVPPITVAPITSSRKVPAPERGPAGLEAGGVEDRGDGRADRGDHEDEDDHAGDRHAGDLGRAAVDADGEDVAAEHRAVEKDMGGDGDRNGDDHRPGDEGVDRTAGDLRLGLFAEIERDEGSLAHLDEIVGKLADVARLGEVDREGADGDQAHQRDHEGRHAQDRHRDAVDEADEGGDGDGGEDREQGAEGDAGKRAARLGEHAAPDRRV